MEWNPNLSTHLIGNYHTKFVFSSSSNHNTTHTHKKSEHMHTTKQTQELPQTKKPPVIKIYTIETTFKIILNISIISVKEHDKINYILSL